MKISQEIHKEFFWLLPVIIIWTILLVIIAFK